MSDHTTELDGGEGPFGPVTRLAKRVLNMPIATVSLDGGETGGDEAWMVDDLSTHAAAAARLEQHPVHSMLESAAAFGASPVFATDGAKLGTLWVASPEVRSFNTEDVQSMQDLAGLAALRFEAGAAAAVQAELLEVAHTEHRRSMVDVLTGVLNRGGISNALETALENGTTSNGLSVVVTDVDKFKSINDTFGHNVGDDVIKAVASRLESSTRDQDSVGRLGGDEFLILLDGCATKAAADRIVTRMFEHVRTDPVRTRGPDGDLEVPVTMSLGVAVIPAGSHCTPDAAIELADQAMYAAKRGGRDRFSIIEAMGLNAA
ncbi:MAG: GGDEF domain-containing protein [Planctomycetota bacterium]